METYRYQRSKLSSLSEDSYNSLAGQQHHSHSTTEYWTNGTTTFLSVDARRPTTRTGFASSLSHVDYPVMAGESALPKQEVAARSSRSANVVAKNNQNERIVRNSLVAGSLAGIASTLAMHPLDVLRTKMQSELTLGLGRNHSPRQVLQHTWQHGGIRALYTGLTLPLAAQAVYKGTVFTVNNVMSQALVDFRTLENHKLGIMEPGRLTMSDRFLCGAIGGAVNAALFVAPVEFVRSQLIAQHSREAAGQRLSHVHWNTWGVIRHSVRQHGVSSLWRGVSWSIYRDAWGCGFFFFIMAWMQQHLTPACEKPTALTTLASGAMGGLAFWVASLPLDTVKTWIQSSDIETNVSAQASLQRIYQQGGTAQVVQQLFRGWQVAYGRGMPAAAITLSVYSSVYRYLAGDGSP